MIDVTPLVEVARPAGENLPFIPRRFQAGGRLEIADSAGIQNTFITTCVLCGGVIAGEEASLEHPLPQWLHKYAGDVGERKASAFRVSETIQPTWRQLSLNSHKECNRLFARKIEDPSITAVKAMVDGGRLTWTQLDAAFDWLDKIKSASAHMATALRGHNIRLGYGDISFPNKRVGAFDRLAIIYRISDGRPPLDLWDCLNDGFLTTPSAITLRVKDLVIVYSSSTFLLSTAFGLGKSMNQNGSATYIPGAGIFAPGFGTRFCRIPSAKILAQPMRRQYQKEGWLDHSPALQKNGDGRVYELIGSRWIRVRSCDFSVLPKLNSRLGYALAALETVEWIILSKEQDEARYGTPESFFLKSLPALHDEKRQLIKYVTDLRGGLPISESDRTTGP
ncbi:hypothetical protein EOA27_20495 [Mesorhizobium sp. M2A.F.Ca.ET.037.01.1.1]|uniref:hypothetical protein n=1 Tax=unclassified Mesorhizobium TaxID=325217 RepID=UPI000FCCE0B1|nr:MULTISPECIES: hypothetical protein [unclassified Mesorhizobium]RUX12122.1 hypothetical protein EOA27_20495 [Mesorhizobium sp. M2A.F.Ca.ET.037.01.1.1]RWA87383.1 MAG: hypothetical protein EOQ31_25140 [Mesorhizobium sp.]RWF23379.1 MAG: hypothetical protein EOS44_27730 [Mesorhizobium sp.]RWX67433.1 hypothetical protein EOA24_16010 [Mesorhizobium sp. M2A.F.Ca.ET.039.01.1.1]TIV17447.1 MAG: hypothetical protein E5V95_17870 [Mesorhizobium sp.]